MNKNKLASHWFDNQKEGKEEKKLKPKKNKIKYKSQTGPRESVTSDLVL